jgi:hypothetical protein
LSNLTGRPVAPKGQRLRKRSNQPTTAHRRHWDRLVKLGCIVANGECRGRITIHHCFTGLGKRKSHEDCLPLCFEHHLGKWGIDGKHLSKREWQERYGTEESLLARARELLA